jgi:hypothetical protein
LFSIFEPAKTKEIKMMKIFLFIYDFTDKAFLSAIESTAYANGTNLTKKK